MFRSFIVKKFWPIFAEIVVLVKLLHHLKVFYIENFY